MKKISLIIVLCVCCAFSSMSQLKVTSEMGTTGTVDPVVSECVLYQNTPNPFSQDTQIKFYIPESVNTALLCIYNLQGTQIKQI